MRTAIRHAAAIAALDSSVTLRRKLNLASLESLTPYVLARIAEGAGAGDNLEDSAQAASNVRLRTLGVARMSGDWGDAGVTVASKATAVLRSIG